MHPALGFALACLLAPTAAPLLAQGDPPLVFRARMSGDQVLPTRSGNELAFADLLLDPLSGALLARVEAPFGTATGAFARVRRGAPGEFPRDIVMVLAQVDPFTFAGELPTPLPAEVDELRRGEWHVELLPPPSVGTTPLLRGALHTGQNGFYFSGEGAQALPPTASPGRFSGNFGFSPDGRATFTIFANCSSPILGATIRFGDANAESSPPLVQITPSINGTSALFLGSSPPLTEAQRARFQQGRVWMTIATQAHPDTAAQPGGELRGTARATSVEYGAGRGANGFAPRVVNLFAWSPGAMLWIDIDHVPTGGTYTTGFVLASLAPLRLPLPGIGELWTDPSRMIALPLPSSGLLIGSVPVGIQPGLWVYLQFLGVGPLSEFYVSPGLAVQTVW